MFTYLCLGSNDLPRAVAFYDSVMTALGLQRCDTAGEPDWDGWYGWGTYSDAGLVDIALWLCEPFNGEPASVGNGTMVALPRRRGNRCRPSTARRCNTAARPKASPVCAPTTARISMRPTCATPMATNWRRCVAVSCRRLTLRTGLDDQR